MTLRNLFLQSIIVFIFFVSGFAQEAGDKCNPGDPAPRDGLICKPAFIELDGKVCPEFEWDPPQLLNAQKGDAILTADCTFIRDLLRQVDQYYSHSGIMIQDRYKIRHSTAAEERFEYEDYLEGEAPSGEKGTDGIRKDILRYGWPGTITEWIDEAFEGAWHVDPESGVPYRITSFNNKKKECLGELAPTIVLTLPDEFDIPTNSQNYLRPLLWNAAEEAKKIQGHYRFYAYSRADLAFSLANIQPGHPSAWADGTYGTVCSSFIWRAMIEAGYTMLEGGQLESTDVGAHIDFCNAPDGLYCYSEDERLASGEFIYQHFYDKAYQKVGGFGNFWTDAADDVANQIANCFAFDWCGTEVPPVECGTPGPQTEYDAKDSECWRNPGIGVAVSTDDLMFWDAAPVGPYGKKHDLVFQPGRWVRTYRWEAAEGTGTVCGVVYGAGSPDPVDKAAVEIEGGNNVGLTAAITGLDGKYEFIGVPGQVWWGLQACKDNVVGKYVPFFMQKDTELEMDLVLNEPCQPGISVSDWHRKVEFNGTLFILDDETPPAAADEHDYYDINKSVQLNPDEYEKEIFISECTGAEVRAEITLIVKLDVHDRSVDVVVVGKLFEGTDCSTDDLEGTFQGLVNFPEGTTNGLLEVKVVNEEWDSDDYFTLSLTVKNILAN